MSNKILQTPIHSDYNLDQEIKNLKYFLDQKGYQIADDFIKQIALGDIIEVYSFPENMQIYSNSEFKKLCSYSEQQMQEIPFPQLFWRDQEVHLSLMKRAAQVCQLEKMTYPWDILNHELVESLHPKKRTFEMKMKNIAPCFLENKTQVSAWASTLQVEFIFEWESELT